MVKSSLYHLPPLNLLLSSKLCISDKEIKTLTRKKNISNLSETELIALAKKDQKYFGPLYERYFEEIFCFIFKRLGGDEEIAGDITQQTFIKAMANMGRYEDRGFKFSSWLYRIAQNEVSMYFRQLKKSYSVAVDENRIADLAQEAELEMNYMSMDQQEKLVEILNSLNESELELIELRFFQAMRFQDIANIYNITEANTKMRIYRLLDKISKLWNERK